MMAYYDERYEQHYEPTPSEEIDELEKELKYLWVRAKEEVEEQDSTFLLKVVKQIIDAENKLHDMHEEHEWKVSAMNERMCRCGEI